MRYKKSEKCHTKTDVFLKYRHIPFLADRQYCSNHLLKRPTVLKYEPLHQHYFHKIIRRMRYGIWKTGNHTPSWTAVFKYPVPEPRRYAVFKYPPPRKPTVLKHQLTPPSVFYRFLLSGEKVSIIIWVVGNKLRPETLIYVILKKYAKSNIIKKYGVCVCLSRFSV